MTAQTPADVFEAMHDLMHAYRRRMRAAVHAIQPDLTHNEVRALLFVGRHPMRTQSDLVEHSGADKAQIARMLNLLEERGLLERVPHPQDKRSRCLALSPAGQAVCETMRTSRRGVTQQMLQGFAQEEEQQLQALLMRLMDNLGE